MSAQLTGQTHPPKRKSVSRFLYLVIATLLLGTAAFALIRAGLLYSFYSSMLGRVSDLTGLDLWASRAIALAIVASAWFLPWHILLLPWIRGSKRKALMGLGIAILTLLGIGLVTRGVYFSRSDGKPLKYYIQTLDGYRFSDSPDVDPVYGVRYMPITAEAAGNYLLWKKHGGRMQDSVPSDGRYFNPATGEPLCWYAALPDGMIELFSLPGFHPKFGMKLLPATVDIVSKYEKQLTDRELLKARQEEQKRKKIARIRRARELALLKLPLQPGRYLFADPGPQGTIHGLKFTLKEVDLTADRTLVGLEVENMGIDPVRESSDSRSSYHIRLAMLTTDGSRIGFSGIHAREGAVLQNNGGIHFPAPGKRGAFVMEYPKITDDPQFTFSIAVNDQPLISGIRLRIALFRKF